MPAWAQDAALQAPPAAAPSPPTVNKGDTAWMMTSTLLVLMMIVPGLALFYGGLTRTKNMLAGDDADRRGRRAWRCSSG